MRLVTGLLPNPYAAYLRVYEPLVVMVNTGIQYLFPQTP